MLLELNDLHVAYGKRTVLNGVSLKVDAGQVLAVVGHNGAGKTTTIKSIMGLVPLESGSVVFDGETISGQSIREISQKGIRMLPAEYRGVFSTRTVLDNLRVAAPKHIYKDKALLNETIEYCLNIFPALREKLGQNAGSLSGGQQQMVAMSVALMGKPKVMLLDEPSIGLQPNLVADMLNEVRRLCDKTGLAVIIVEQNAKVALQIADRVAAIRTGTIIHEGPAADITMDDLWNLF